MLEFIQNVFLESWNILVLSSLYIIFGLVIGGLLKVYISPAFVARQLGSGRFKSVFKAALLGVPIPLCSCGVLPAAASLKRQGANNGATTAFLISTPESGVDSISITYALLDPIMTVARPISAFLSAFAAGITENIFEPPKSAAAEKIDISCPVDNCCDGMDCPPEIHKNHHRFREKLFVGIRYATIDIWNDLAGWFLIGILAAGVITVLIPDEVIGQYLGGGISSMLLMVAFGIPLYICATASTPIAAAFILKGVSPGTALVFLLVGPATNITSLAVLISILGKRATMIYLVCIVVVAVLCGLVVDYIYILLAINAVALIGQCTEIFPEWFMITATLFLIILSVRPLSAIIQRWFRYSEKRCGYLDDSCTTILKNNHAQRGCSTSCCKPDDLSRTGSLKGTDDRN